MTDPIDEGALDVWLAKVLHSQGRVPESTLLDLLERTRTLEGSTLAKLLVSEGLLHEEETREILDGLTRGATVAGTEPPAPQRSPGPTVGEYRLMGKLGKGGMGEVFEAEHQGTGARHAIKILAPRPTEQRLVRFQREGEVLAAVSGHPNVLGIHAAGIAHERLYLVTDLAPGGDLEDRLRGGPLDVREAAELVGDLARGVAHVHACGVLHRDIKPANILFDEEGTAQLADFGLAKLAGVASLTLTGQVMGTPGYMAPEQARGRQMDERTDVYGLGALLYCTLTGNPPSEGANVMESLARVLKVDPPAPRSLRPEVPSALDAICMRALAKDPGARQASAEALADELDGFLAGVPAPGQVSFRTLLVLVLLGVVASLMVPWALGAFDAQPAGEESGAKESSEEPEELPPEPAPVRKTLPPELKVLPMPQAERARFLGPDRALVITARRHLVVIDLASGKELFHQPISIRWVGFWKGGEFLCYRGTTLYSVDSALKMRELARLGRVVSFLASSPHRAEVAAGARSGHVRVGAAASLRDGSHLSVRLLGLRHLIFSGDGNHVIGMTTKPGRVVAWRVPNGPEVVNHQLPPDRRPRFVVAAPGGRWFVVSTLLGELLRYDLTSPERVEPFVLDAASAEGTFIGGAHPDASSAAFNADGSLLFSAGHDVREWDMTRLRSIKRYLKRDVRYGSVDISADGRLLLVIPGVGLEVWPLELARRS